MRVLYSIFVEDTLRYIIRMFPGFLLAALMLLALHPWRLRRLAGKGLSSSLLREAALLLFWLFCGGMAVLTLTPGWFDWLPLLQGLKPVYGPFFSLGSWNLAPGRCFEGGLWQSYMLLGNIINNCISSERRRYPSWQSTWGCSPGRRCLREGRLCRLPRPAAPHRPRTGNARPGTSPPS